VDYTHLINSTRKATGRFEYMYKRFKKQLLANLDPNKNVGFQFSELPVIDGHPFHWWFVYKPFTILSNFPSRMRTQRDINVRN